jgi:hypothetical protein
VGVTESGQRPRRALNVAALWVGRDLARSVDDGPASRSGELVRAVAAAGRDAVARPAVAVVRPPRWLLAGRRPRRLPVDGVGSVPRFPPTGLR